MVSLPPIFFPENLLGSASIIDRGLGGGASCPVFPLWRRHLTGILSTINKTLTREGMRNSTH